MTVPKFVARKLLIDAGRSRKKPPGKPSIFSVRVPTADVADFGSSTGNDGGMIVGAALGVEVVEAIVAVVVVFQRFGRCQHNVVNMSEQ